MERACRLVDILIPATLQSSDSLPGISFFAGARKVLRLLACTVVRLFFCIAQCILHVPVCLHILQHCFFEHSTGSNGSGDISEVLSKFSLKPVASCKTGDHKTLPGIGRFSCWTVVWTDSFLAHQRSSQSPNQDSCSHVCRYSDVLSLLWHSNKCTGPNFTAC